MSDRALSFGAVAEAYERYRPGYPVELLDLVLAYAGRPLRTALEIGAGTGKATRLFARPGETYGLVYAAAALHWTRPEARWARMAGLLDPGGVVASFGGPMRLADPALAAAGRFTVRAGSS